MIFHRAVLFATLGIALCPGYAQADQFNGPSRPQSQREFCRILREFYSDQDAYVRRTRTMSDVQRAEAPKPPNIWSYNDRFVALLGHSGAFQDWVGTASAGLTGDGRTAFVFMRFDCVKREIQPLDVQEYQFSTTNVAQPILQIDRTEVAEGYGPQLFSNPTVKALATIPNDGVSHYSYLSGNLKFGSSPFVGYESLNGNGVVGQMVVSTSFLARFTAAHVAK